LTLGCVPQLYTVMARQYSSGGYTMIISSQREGERYYAGWFCTCEKCWGFSKEAYPTEEAALNAGEKHLIHLYQAHPEVKAENELPKSN